LKKKPKLHHPYGGIKLVTRGTSVSDHSGNWLQTVTSSHSIHQKRSINQPPSSLGPNISQPLPTTPSAPQRATSQGQKWGPRWRPTATAGCVFYFTDLGGEEG
jgi:hypothetical protein